MKKNLFAFCFLLFTFCFFSGCKKNRLTDKYENLIGTWEWDWSTYNYTCGYNSCYDFISQDSIGIRYSMEFDKKGKLFLQKEGKTILTCKTKKNTGSCDIEENTLCLIVDKKLNIKIVFTNTNKNRISITQGDGFFPYSGEKYINHFVKID